MNKHEKEVAVRIARVVRAGRKVSGVSQIDLAKKLGISQGSLSKIESGTLIPSMPSWYLFNESMGIDSENAYHTGKIDRCLPIKAGLSYPESTFKMPTSYSRDRKSKVRALLPFISYFEKRFGMNGWEDYCAQKRIDSDFFIVLDNEISIKFTLDLANHLIQSDGMNATQLSQLVRPAQLPEFHGRLSQVYNEVKSVQQLLKTAIRNASQYEANFKYKLEDETPLKSVMSITPAEHLKGLEYRGGRIDDFLCRYKKSYFKRFLAYGGAADTAEIVESQCHFKGHESCIYHINLAI